MCVDAFMVCWEKGEEMEKATEYAIESFAFFKKQIQGKKSLSRNDTCKLFGSCNWLDLTRLINDKHNII